MTVIYQQIGNVGGDKTRPAGNQNFHAPLLFTITGITIAHPYVPGDEVAVFYHSCGRN
jgi:hypothetical protein